MHTRTEVLQANCRTVLLRNIHVVDTQVGSPGERVVLDEVVSVGVGVLTRTERHQDHLYVLGVPAFCDLLQNLRRLLKLVSCET